MKSLQGRYQFGFNLTIDATVALTFATIIAYVENYAYMSGYYSCLGISNDQIVISISTLLPFWILTTVLLTFCMFILMGIFIDDPKIVDNGKYYVIWIAMVMLVIFFGLLMWQFGRTTYLVPAAISALSSTLLIAAGMLNIRSGERTPEFTIIRRSLSIGLALGATFGFFFSAGFFFAHQISNPWVLKNHPELAVISQENNILILKTIDLKNGKFLPGFTLMKLPDTATVSFIECPSAIHQAP